MDKLDHGGQFDHSSPMGKNPDPPEKAAVDTTALPMDERIALCLHRNRWTVIEMALTLGVPTKTLRNWINRERAPKSALVQRAIDEFLRKNGV